MSESTPDPSRRPGPGRQWHVPAPGTTPPPAAPARATPPPAQAPRQPAPRASPPAPPQQRRPAPAPAAPPPPRPPKARRKWGARRWLLLALVLVVALVVLWVLWLFSSWRAIDRVDLEDVLDPVSGSAVNYLLVGSDSRENLDPEAPEGAAPTVEGRRADTIILLRVAPEGSTMMSIPRDLWVTIADTGKKGRINGSYNSGPANLVATVKDNLGVPVNHYAEVDFASFSGVIDAVGGVTITVEHPALDPASGLVIPVAGPNLLDGTMALAYVRSRNYTEVIDGREVKDPTADLGRQQRQQQFLLTAMSEVGATRNPIELGRAVAALSGGLTVDTGMSMWDAATLARRLSGSPPESVVLPTEGARIGGASVLLLQEEAAQPVLDLFR